MVDYICAYNGVRSVLRKINKTNFYQLWTGPKMGSREISIIVYKKMAMITLDVVESSDTITRSQRNIIIKDLSIRCVYLCEIDVLPPATSCTLPVILTVFGACKGSVLT